MDWKRTFGEANTTLASNGASVHKTERVGEMVNLSLTMVQEHNHKAQSAVRVPANNTNMHRDLHAADNRKIRKKDNIKGTVE
jgi:hypothetical protein